MTRRKSGTRFGSHLCHALHLHIKTVFEVNAWLHDVVNSARDHSLQQRRKGHLKGRRDLKEWSQRDPRKTLKSLKKKRYLLAGREAEQWSSKLRLKRGCERCAIIFVHFVILNRQQRRGEGHSPCSEWWQLVKMESYCDRPKQWSHGREFNVLTSFRRHYSQQTNIDVKWNQRR